MEGGGEGVAQEEAALVGIADGFHGFGFQRGHGVGAGDDIQAHAIGEGNDVGQVRLAAEHVVDGSGKLARAQAQGAGGVSLGIDIDDEHALARGGQIRAQVDGGGGLAHAAFLIGNRVDSGHGPGCASM